jgi:hypothetical protein
VLDAAPCPTTVVRDQVAVRLVVHVGMLVFVSLLLIAGIAAEVARSGDDAVSRVAAASTVGW